MGSRTQKGSRSGSGCRRSRCRSASASASSSSPARGSRSRCSSGCRAPTRRRWRRRAKRPSLSRSRFVRALASPASCKGVLSAVEAAMALSAGMRMAGLDAEELPVADGGEGAAEALGLRRVGEEERDPMRATSRGLGELLLAAAAAASGPILVCLGDSATVDGGAGLRAAVGDGLAGRELVGLCDVRNRLLGERGAARAFGPQKGASPQEVEELEARLAAMEELRPYAEVPGAGAAGGLGAAIAALGGELVSGAELVLERVGFRGWVRGADLVVTGEGRVDRSSSEGKAVGEVVRVCAEEGVRCVVFGGQVAEALNGVEMYALSGDPRRAAEDLVELGEKLGGALLGFA